ncbi:pyridoxamine 5'-phosphate oxidase family protein [Bradyrhizobium barranii]|uniref:pyridoxamine 5'-phosphate oxidase family protein n=1 Tax=Bradyrhizobium barranii TaxID=2992140 RepID=UPI002AB2150A|nr:pyridoxamine 5'-phosphate oxidase family protein [Bradyrhizobium barranii]
MSKKSLAEIAKEMAGIDIAILSTHTENGEIANRPMSNNGDVAYDGTSHYFTYEKSRTVSDIQRNPKCRARILIRGRSIRRRDLCGRRRDCRTDPRQGRLSSALDK